MEPLRRRRLPRTLLNATTVISAAICFCVLSLRVTQGKWLLVHRPTAHMLAQDGTRLYYCRARFPAWAADVNFGHFAGIMGDAAGLVTSLEADHHALGVSWISDDGWVRGSAGKVEAHITLGSLPTWLAALATGTLPAARLLGAVQAMRIRRRRRSAAHLCPACNYDLRATPDRCPECGTISTR